MAPSEPAPGRPGDTRARAARPGPPDARERPGRRDRWGGRPFGAGAALVLGGAEILLVQRAGPATLLASGADVRYALPLLMCLCGLLLVLHPGGRRAYAVVGVLASLGTWVASDLGGFLLGTTLGLAGGALATGRAPDRAE
ncbi:DUF6114 domain-containing protein [Streptomyces omiyaensis]|uniref:DUF6114 domain-containing protein n=1 Tax=Streptomyces omiyaensis TaxID=68247 RepID=A0ABW7BU26_9ACTN|nr:DUF6114 domain-containing protein [Streptomyces omiyaensis]GGY40030.1 hypothetical protein GCM10010363_20910 [Streptomyces omiyaensis]